MGQGDRLRRADDPDQLASAGNRAPHRHQSLLHNPVPRRNQSDNSTDMSSFPFVRHHFLRAGFEVVDCPPLTAQLKNSADIRTGDGCARHPHPRHLLRRIRHPFGRCRLHAGVAPAAFARTAHGDLLQRSHGGAVTAICDAEIRQADLLSLLIDGQLTNQGQAQRSEPQALPSAASIEALRTEIFTEVANVVRAADQPVPLEALADRCVRVLGHEKTVGAAWGGTGSFRDLLTRGLPEDIRLTPQPPYFVYDANREQTKRPGPRRESKRARRASSTHGPTSPDPSRCAPNRRTAIAACPGAVARHTTSSTATCHCPGRGPRPGAARTAGPGAARSPLGSAGASSPAARRRAADGPGRRSDPAVDCAHP